METTNRIILFAEKIAQQDAEKLKKHDDWINYISPLFFSKYGKKYEYQYDSMRSKEVKNFLATEYKKFEFL